MHTSSWCSRTWSSQVSSHHTLRLSFISPFRAIQTLCDGGADHLLTDIEGNYPKDLAEKNHHGKCAKYLANLGRIRSKGSSTGMVGRLILEQSVGINNVWQDSSGSKLKRQHNASKTMMDNYRNAPPHQVNEIQRLPYDIHLYLYNYNYNHTETIECIWWRWWWWLWVAAEWWTVGGNIIFLKV